MADLGDQLNIAGSLESLARLAVDRAALARAARIWGGAARLRQEIGSPMTPRTQVSHDRDVVAARAAMADDAAFDFAWREGASMPLEQAVEYALRQHDN